jgi:hypothetical protein
MSAVNAFADCYSILNTASDKALAASHRAALDRERSGTD